MTPDLFSLLAHHSASLYQNGSHKHADKENQ
jgi:hypothetical protein